MVLVYKEIKYINIIIDNVSSTLEKSRLELYLLNPSYTYPIIHQSFPKPKTTVQRLPSSDFPHSSLQISTIHTHTPMIVQLYSAVSCFSYCIYINRVLLFIYIHTHSRHAG